MIVSGGLVWLLVGFGLLGCGFISRRLLCGSGIFFRWRSLCRRLRLWRVLLGKHAGGCEQKQPGEKNAIFYESHRANQNTLLIGCTGAISGSAYSPLLILDLSSALSAADYKS